MSNIRKKSRAALKFIELINKNGIWTSPYNNITYCTYKKFNEIWYNNSDSRRSKLHMFTYVSMDDKELFNMRIEISDKLSDRPKCYDFKRI